MLVEKQPQIEKESIPIARAVCVAPVSFFELSRKLRNGISVSDVTFSEALLIRKNKESKPSKGLVMPIGGEVAAGEDRYQGMLREVAEESTFVSLSGKGKQKKEPTSSYVYQIPGANYKNPRDIELFVHPVQSRSFSLQIPREGFDGGEDKIAEVVSLSPIELRQLVTKGFLGNDDHMVKAAGHFTLSDDVTISISDENKQKRNAALEGVLSDVDAFEEQLRSTTLKAVNILKKVKQEEAIDDLSQATPAEITTGFVAAQMKMALADEREREKEGAAYPPVKADLLKILPYLAVVPPEMLPDLLLIVPTKEIVNCLKKFEKGFDKGVNLLISHLQLDVEKKEQVREMSSIDALKESWSDFNKLPLVERNNLLNNIEEEVIKGITEDDVDTTREDISNAVEIMEHFHDFVTNELKKQKDAAVEIFQEHRPMNEILNAGLFARMVYSLGLYPDINFKGKDTDTLKILRFEAMRDLAVFAVGIESAKLLKDTNNNLFQSALNTFFDFPPRREQMVLGTDKVHNVYRRTQKTSGLDVLVDERVKKTPESEARKLFQANTEELYDTFSVNFVLANDNFNNKENPVKVRLDAANTFREDLLAHMRKEMNLLSESQQVSIVPGTQKIAPYSRVYEAQEGIMQNEYGGIRAGSKGDAIIRDKFILSLDKGDDKPQFIEVCIYPFQTTSLDEFSSLKEAGLWGFAEKLYDDDYSARRLLNREKASPTKPSLYELLYQGVLYSFLSERMRRRHILSRKGVHNGHS